MPPLKGQRRFWLGRPSGLFIWLATLSWYQCPKYEWDMLWGNRHTWSDCFLAHHWTSSCCKTAWHDKKHTFSSATWDVSCQKSLICLSIITLTFEVRLFLLMVRMIGIRETLIGPYVHINIYMLHVNVFNMYLGLLLTEATVMEKLCCVHFHRPAILQII